MEIGCWRVSVRRFCFEVLDDRRIEQDADALLAEYFAQLRACGYMPFGFAAFPIENQIVTIFEKGSGEPMLVFHREIDPDPWWIGAGGDCGGI